MSVSITNSSCTVLQRDARGSPLQTVFKFMAYFLLCVLMAWTQCFTCRSFSVCDKRPKHSTNLCLCVAENKGEKEKGLRHHKTHKTFFWSLQGVCVIQSMEQPWNGQLEGGSLCFAESPLSWKRQQQGWW